MPIFKAPSPEPLILPPVPQHPIRLHKTTADISPEHAKRIERLGTAAHVISLETRKIRGELKRQGIDFPEVIQYILEDFDDVASTLTALLLHHKLIPAKDADNQPGRDDQADTGTDDSKDGRTQEDG